MGRLVFSINVTLDGCIDHTQGIADEEHHDYFVAMLDQVDAALFGRITYRMMEEYWPAVAASGEGPQSIVDFARKLDRMPKYVVSRTIEQVSWQNTVLLRGLEEVARLKAEGMNLLVSGGPGLGSALAEAGLVDRFHFVLQPIVAGRGPYLLDGIHSRLNLKLLESRTFGSGAIALHYAPA